MEIEKTGSIWTIILNRSACRNAVDGPTAAALAAAFREFEASKSAKVAVFWGKGGNFSSGADLKAIGSESQNRIESDHDAPLGISRMNLAKPVIAAISGYAVAGGLELALWADLRVAEEGSFLGVSCRRFGIPLIDGGTVRLPALIGLGRALDLVLTGRLVTAREAKEMGLVNRVVGNGESRMVAQELAEQIAQFPQACLLSDRRSVYEQWGKSLAQALENEFTLGAQIFQKPDFIQYVKRFIEGEGRGGQGID